MYAKNRKARSLLKLHYVWKLQNCCIYPILQKSALNMLEEHEERIRYLKKTLNVYTPVMFIGTYIM